MFKKALTLLIVLVLGFSYIFLLPEKCEASWLLERYLAQRGNNAVEKPVQPPTDPKDTVPAYPVPTNPDPQTPSMVLKDDATLMIDMVNNERIKNGLKPLEVLPALMKAAEDKSIDMVENNYFSHSSPTYGPFYSMVYSRGIRFRSVGENLAKARNTKTAFYLLMGSEPHKKNMLNPYFTHIGVGIVKDKYGVVVTQLFIAQ